MTLTILRPGDRAAVVGFGVTGRSVARALAARDISPVVVDDAPGPDAHQAAAAIGVDLHGAPSPADLDRIIASVTAVLPTPGLPDAHGAFAAARAAGTPILSEFDLARQWDDRPVVAVTGTNGKTTVTTMVTDMLNRSGRIAAAVGNTDVPLVEALGDAEIDTFVVEASSFRLGHSEFFAPDVGTWLNFTPDHLDIHASLEAYEAAKARIWRDQGPDDVAIANAEDQTVMANLGVGRGRAVTYGLDRGENHVVDATIVVDGSPLMSLDELRRARPHDVSNAVGAATTALAAGADRDAICETLRTFAGLAHRVELIGARDGVEWYDDSKATTPHAVIAALAGFESAVLIAGGKNKGLDLSALADAASRLRGVVAIGDAAADVEAAFAGRVPVQVATDMADAVARAAAVATCGDAVVLSPGCASFDWYSNYGERGDHFASLVRSMVLEAS